MIRRALLLLGLASCTTDPVVTTATVDFTLDAPFCGFRQPVQFLIDSVLVGTDTFSVNYTPQHLTSQTFTTSAGSHRIGARFVSGYVWPDTVVTLAPLIYASDRSKAAFVRRLLA